MKPLCTLLTVVLALAITGSVWGQAPPEIQAMNDLPNAADLYLVYCSHNNKSCVTRRAICYGQCGNQYSADEMGYGCSGDIEGTVPAGYHYARWFSIGYQSEKRTGGLATKKYNTKDCQNPR